MRQLLVYLKLTLVAGVAIGIALIVFQNRSYRTKFWPWAADREVSTLWLMLATSIVSILLFWILSKTRSVLREYRQLRAEQARERERAEQARRRAELEEQERRIDAKIKRALGGNNSQG